MGVLLDSQLDQDRYFKGDSTPPDEGASLSPGYPTHDQSRANIRVQ